MLNYHPYKDRIQVFLYGTVQCSDSIVHMTTGVKHHEHWGRNIRVREKHSDDFSIQIHSTTLTSIFVPCTHDYL